MTQSECESRLNTKQRSSGQSPNFANMCTSDPNVNLIPIVNPAYFVKVKFISILIKLGFSMNGCCRQVRRVKIVH